MDYDPGKPLPVQEQQALQKCLDMEMLSMATEGYSQSQNAILRRNAVHIIFQHSKSEKFDAFIPYLAMNYFDRYISKDPLPTLENRVRDNLFLLAISCLTLAWKMRSKSFSFTNFLSYRNLNIDGRNVLKVELMILNGLEWRMRAVTAICFVGFFVNKIHESRGFTRRTINEIIIQAQGDITFTQFRPSVIAASALLAASSYLYPTQVDIYKRAIVTGGHVKEEDVTACLRVMTDMCETKNIVMESAHPESGEGPRLRVKAGEPSGSLQPSQPAPNEPSTSHRAGKAPMEKTSEIQEVPESEQAMNFELKWVTNENEDLTIDSPLFRPMVPDEPGDVDTETDVATTCGSCKPQCCNQQ